MHDHATNRIGDDKWELDYVELDLLELRNAPGPLSHLAVARRHPHLLSAFGLFY